MMGNPVFLQTVPRVSVIQALETGPLLDADSNVVYSAVEKAEIFYGYFCSVLGQRQPPISFQQEAVGE